MLRVDNIPWYIKPFFLLYAYGAGVFLYGYSWLMHATCRIEFIGAPLPKNSAAVYCIWHTDLVFYFTVFPKVKKQIWMNHPAWYMKPIHVLLNLTGVEHICLGSSGNSGKVALEKVIGYLKLGYSTAIASDGPAGPAKELKPGVLFMSRDANVPVIPLRFLCSNSFRLGGWDRKFIPMLFSEIRVVVGEAIQVEKDNLEISANAITRHLNG